MCLDYFFRHTVLNAQQIESGRAVFRFPLVNKSGIAEAHVVELPQHLQVHVAAHAGAAAEWRGEESSASERACRRGSAAEDNTRNQRPPTLLLEKRERSPAPEPAATPTRVE